MISKAFMIIGGLIITITCATPIILSDRISVGLIFALMPGVFFGPVFLAFGIIGRRNVKRSEELRKAADAILLSERQRTNEMSSFFAEMMARNNDK